jgi:hypothetical protein
MKVPLTLFSILGIQSRVGGVGGDGAQLGVEERGARDGRRSRPDQRQRPPPNPTELIKFLFSFFYSILKKSNFRFFFILFYFISFL